MSQHRLVRFPYVAGKLDRVLILCHRHGDVDAYCSAYGIASLLRQVYRGVKVEVSAPEGFSSLAKRVHEEYKMKIVEEPKFDKADLIVVVDTGHALLLKEWAEKVKNLKVKKVFIDHHPANETIGDLADHIIVDTKATSTCEIVYKIYKAKGSKVTKKVAEALMLGLLCDSQQLVIAKCSTIKAVAELCSLGAKIEKARSILSLRRDVSEGIARLKAAKRSDIYRADRWIVGTTTVGSFQASAARALLELGAHVSFAVGEDEEGIKGSLRATPEFCSETGIHLGLDIASKLGEELKGVGGGHAGAASFRAQASQEEALRLFLKLIKEKLRLELEKLS